MIRALSRQSGRVQLSELPTPNCIHSDDVRVRVSVAGLCRTDLYVARGTLPVREPMTLGHEFAGIVVEAGATAEFRIGEHVTAHPLLACGTCGSCRAGRGCLGPRFLGVDVDGAFADEIVLPGKNLRRVPSTLDPRCAAYTEPVAAALAVLNAPLPRQGLGVILGNSRVAALTECILIQAGYENLQRYDVAAGSGLVNEADFVVETEANANSLQLMLDLLRPGGIAVLKSRPTHCVPLNVALAVKKDITLFAVSYGCFDRAIELISSGALGLNDFFGDTYSLDAFREAFDASESAAAYKTFLQLN